MAKERDKEAFEMRASGKKLKEIAEHLGVGVARAGSMVKSYKYFIENQDEFKSLSTRSHNCLRNAGIKTKDQLIEFLNSEEYPWEKMKGFRNFGVTGYNEVCDFAGLPEKKHTKESGVERCHCCGQIIKKKA